MLQYSKMSSIDEQWQMRRESITDINRNNTRNKHDSIKEMDDIGNATTDMQ